MKSYVYTYIYMYIYTFMYIYVMKFTYVCIYMYMQNERTIENKPFGVIAKIHI